MFSLILILMFCSIAYSGNFRERIFNAPCGPDRFRCLNNVCISRHLFCNQVNNCGDNSDEIHCSEARDDYDYNNYECPTMYPFYKCNYRKKCIPVYWKCDGIQDCVNKDDEDHCDKHNAETFSFSLNPEIPTVQQAKTKAIRWLLNQAENKTAMDRWGAHVRKLAVALYLGDPMFVNSSTYTRREMAYEISIQLLSRFALRKLKEVSTSDLSSFINAFLVTCQDPRKFHAVNLVRELRSRVNAQNYTVPYDILTLCNAGEKITEKDIEKLKNTFSNEQREFWTDTQAIAIMALVCAGNQPGSNFSLSQLPDFTMKLKQKQLRNGIVDNLQTTALVMQALFSSEPEDDENNFDEEKALQQILRAQKEDGSFGSIVNTYYVLPVLNYKSLVNISSDHCAPNIKDEVTGLQDLINLPGPKIRVRYSLWIGHDREVERTVKLKVASNASFYGVIEAAGDIDWYYRFQYVMKSGKPHVYSISGIQDDPESGKFWFPYVLSGTKPSPVLTGIVDLFPKDSDHLVMWYQSGSWIK